MEDFYKWTLPSIILISMAFLGCDHQRNALIPSPAVPDFTQTRFGGFAVFVGRQNIFT